MIVVLILLYCQVPLHRTRPYTHRKHIAQTNIGIYRKTFFVETILLIV